MFENLTVNLKAFCNPCVKIECCSSDLIYTFLYAGSSIQNASDQFISFVNFALLPTPQTKIQRIRMPDSNSSNSVTIQN